MPARDRVTREHADRLVDLASAARRAGDSTAADLAAESARIERYDAAQELAITLIRRGFSPHFWSQVEQLQEALRWAEVRAPT